MVLRAASIKYYSLQRGVAITVDNLSARTLGSPTLWVRCGWVDDRLGTAHPVSRAVNEPSRSFSVPGEGPYHFGIILVKRL